MRRGMKSIPYIIAFISGLCLRTWIFGTAMNGADIIVAFAATALVYGIMGVVQPRKKKNRR